MRLITFILTLLLLAPAAYSAAPRWENTGTPPPAASARSGEPRTDEATLSELAVSDGCIYVMAGRTVNVKVFTILGQLISQETLPPGTHRLRMASRGIYIVKLGGSTRRVTL